MLQLEFEWVCVCAIEQERARERKGVSERVRKPEPKGNARSEIICFTFQSCAWIYK